MVSDEHPTRGKLLGAARTCLLKHGYAQSTVKRIAAEAGMNHGLIHHYFGSKDGMWEALVAGEAETMRQEVLAIISGNLASISPAELLDRIAGVLAGNAERTSLLMEFMAIGRQVEGVRKTLRQIIDDRRQMFTKLLGGGDHVRGTLIFGALFGLALQHAMDPGTQLQDAFAEMLRHLVSRPDAMI